MPQWLILKGTCLSFLNNTFNLVVSAANWQYRLRFSHIIIWFFKICMKGNDEY